MSEASTVRVAHDRLRPDRAATVVAFGRLAAVADGIGSGDVRVVGQGQPTATEPQQGRTGDGTPANSFPSGNPALADAADADTGVVFVATPLADADREPAALLEELSDREAMAIAVVALPAPGEPAGTAPVEAVEGLRSTADATVVLRPDERDVMLRDLITSIADLATTPGLINLDLADVRAVLPSGSLARVGSAHATTATGAKPPAVTAVEDARATVASDGPPADGILVQLVADATLSLAEAVAAVEVLQPAVDPDGSLIWGVRIDPARTGVQATVVAGFEALPRIETAIAATGRLRADGPCPRCGGHVATYTFGDRERLACDRCDYSGVDLRL